MFLVIKIKDTKRERGRLTSSTLHRGIGDNLCTLK